MDSRAWSDIEVVDYVQVYLLARVNYSPLGGRCIIREPELCSVRQYWAATSEHPPQATPNKLLGCVVGGHARPLRAPRSPWHRKRSEKQKSSGNGGTFR